MACEFENFSSSKRLCNYITLRLHYGFSLKGVQTPERKLQITPRCLDVFVAFNYGQFQKTSMYERSDSLAFAGHLLKNYNNLSLVSVCKNFKMPAVAGAPPRYYK